MTKITDTFAQLEARNEAALVAYLTIGDPNLKQTPQLAASLIEGGADIIELGIPFSDPIADGPTIQEAVARSLTAGTKPADAFEIAHEINERYDTPLVLMTYYNPIFRTGLTKFLGLAKESGISGIIVPDLPIEESSDYKAECSAAGVDTIFLASPSTDRQRLDHILSQTSGYLYLISLYGVTGLRANLPDSVLDLVKKYRAITAGFIPLAVGFGISTPVHVQKLVQAGADGVIVGSAFVNVIGGNSQNITLASTKLEDLARKMKKATTKTAGVA
jgi:tryptophan synthase alpha chain